MSTVRSTVEETFRAPAEIFFVRSWQSGLALWAALVVLYPSHTFTATAALAFATALHPVFRARVQPTVRPWIGLNAFLLGMGFVHFYGAPSDASAMMRLATLVFMQQAVYYALMSLLTTRLQLPVLTLPFVIMTRVAVAFWPATSVGTDWGLASLASPSIDAWLPASIAMVLRSLGALLFMRDVLVGACIAGVLLVYSRILFSGMIVAGLAVAFASPALPANVHPEIVAFNAMVTMVMIAAVLEVPSRWSYANGALFAIIAAFIAIAGSLWWQPVLNLPFILAVYGYVLTKPLLATEHSLPLDFLPGTPEQNLYYAQNRRERYAGLALAPFTLPFNGEWVVTQGHDGEFTHRDAWRHAWDFEQADPSGAFTSGATPHLSSYYAWLQPVCAAMDGEVANIQNHIPDNEPGSFNFRQNWGNTVVLRHANGLYSACSHLTSIPDAIVVGRWLNRGEIIGYCGNSGRSDRPHVHFQFQSTPRIGDVTTEVPIKRYLVRTNGGFELRTATTPQAGERVVNIDHAPRVAAAFVYPFGKELTATGLVGSEQRTEKWISTVDFNNHTYLYCEQTGASAFFFSEEGVFYFSDFFGPRHSLLGLFTLAASRIVFTGMSNVRYVDQLPLNRVGRGPANALVDMLSPLARVRELRVEYTVAEERDRTIMFRNRVISAARIPWRHERAVAEFETALPYGVQVVRVRGSFRGVAASFTVSY